MATLDDKLLGEKLHYYCSSSSEDEQEPSLPEEQPAPLPAAGNTGPKGVISDWRRFKQLESEKREEEQSERLALAKRLALTCRCEREDREADSDQLKDDDDDDFIKNYLEKRMRELVSRHHQAAPGHRGSLMEIADGDGFLSVVDCEQDRKVPVVIGIYEPGYPGCDALLGCLGILANQHPGLKFCKVASSSIGLSIGFKTDGVPAILVYKAGQLQGSFIRITDQLGNDFFASDLGTFLQDQGVLADQQEDPHPRPSALRGCWRQADHSDDSD